MRKLYVLIFLIGSIQFLSAQQIKNSYIIDLKYNKAESFIKNNTLLSSRSDQPMKMLSKTLDIVQLTALKESDQEIEKWLDEHPDIESWAYNHYVQKREEPNDEYFSLQWGLELISAPDAWNVTTGGFDVNGNEIVVVVLDDSYDLTHPDLVDRVFINESEIPDDGIDNDNNGYIDDYQGWNTTDETDDHPLIDNHGIAVSGIIGANTDNEIGMAGINWQVKILPISGIATQAEVIGGYEYAINMRRRYNESNGTEGAFVVATNYSAGIDNAFGTSPTFKVWCDMYDAMGDVGILSAGATANKNVNVDEDGDMPTTCPSEFLIAVTNMDNTDSKVSNAGYGALNIDVGAPGKGTVTLDTDDGYDNSFGGTSAATPHVAGTVALLYSVPCSAIADLAFDNPREAARIIRDALYDGVDQNTTLEGITATGGRINIFGAMEKLQNTCEDLNLPSPKGDLNIETIEIESTNSVSISYLTPDETEYSVLMSDALGRTVRHFDFIPPTTGRKLLRFDIPGLPTGIYFISIYNKDTISTKSIFVNAN